MVGQDIPIFRVYFFKYNFCLILVSAGILPPPSATSQSRGIKMFCAATLP